MPTTLRVAPAPAAPAVWVVVVPRPARWVAAAERPRAAAGPNVTPYPGESSIYINQHRYA